jgi:putative transposase
MLQREGFQINHKRTYRLYKEAGLILQKRSKKKKYEKRGMPERTATTPNVRWSMVLSATAPEAAHIFVY